MHRGAKHTGDKPAQNFERGTQQGGNFKCGSCGVKSTMIQGQAHSLCQTWRSLEDLQKLVLAGCYGNKAGCSKPLNKLRAKDLRQELRARGVFDVTGKVEELQRTLDNILCGAQRVPTLLIHNPAQNLASLNLQQYTILACEPLHALKGIFTTCLKNCHIFYMTI